jgi:two-component system, chemotaxis family, chemotaxis protein CheY
MVTKIIVIDDSRVARQQATSVLQNAGYDVVEAIDGSDGLEKIAQHGDARMVLCDVNMPKLNGIEVLAATASTPAPKPAFLMVTTEGQPELVQRAKQHGAKGWIIKPYKPELLLAAVRRLAG